VFQVENLGGEGTFSVGGRRCKSGKRAESEIAFATMTKRDGGGACRTRDSLGD
jgi:hypothetical protein